MNSVKTALVSLILLGVLYGMYQVLSSPSPQFDEDGRFVAESPIIEDGTPIGDERSKLSPDQALASVAGGADGSSREPIRTASPGTIESGSAGPQNPRMTSSESSAPATTIPAPSAFAASNASRSSFAPSPAPSLTGGGTSPSNPSTPSGSAPPANADSFAPSSFTASGSTNNSTTSPPVTPPPSTGNAATPSSPAGSSFVPGGALSSNAGSGGSFAAPSASTTPPAGSVPQTSGSSRWPSTRTSREIEDAAFRDRLVAAWTLTDSLIAQGKFKEALQELTFFYDDPRLSPEEASTLLAWLDSLAAKVIYSTEHLWEEPYIVRQGDTLASVATAFGISEQLLFNINASKLRGQTGALTAGVELKVVTGPFRLRVEPSKQRMTLFVGNCYAGRFSIVESSGLTPANDLQVALRFRDAVATNGQSATLPVPTSGSWGEYVIQLSNSVMIHQANQLGGVSNGLIGVSQADAWDLFSILNEGCQVSIQQ